MSQKKKHVNASQSPKPSSKAKAPARGGAGKRIWIVGAIIILGIVAATVVSNNGQSSKGGGQAAVPAEEQKYLGRFLPTGYTGPKVAEAAAYTSVVKMSPVSVTTSGSEISIPLNDVVASKIVTFDAQKAGQPLTMIAYVKPSGKLFVGVSYCPPCKGKGQRLEADGTLTCESCGTKRNPETQVGISGACKRYPLDELVATVAGDRIVVAQAAIDDWSEQPLDRKVGE